MDIIERLRFDAARCEQQFSKGIAGNIEEAADEIERLRADFEAMKTWALDSDDTNDRLRAEIKRLRAALKPFEQSAPRCNVTGNLVGTDTWMVGHECQCQPCQTMLREGARGT